MCYPEAVAEKSAAGAPEEIDDIPLSMGMLSAGIDAVDRLSGEEAVLVAAEVFYSMLRAYRATTISSS